MDIKKIIERIDTQLQTIDSLKSLTTESPEFKKWHRDTLVCLKNIPNKDNKFYHEFDHIHFSFPFPMAMASSSGERRSTSKLSPEYYQKGLKNAKILLQSIIDEIKEYGLDSPSMQSNTTSTQKVYVNPSRIKELQSISNPSFDLLKLIRYCEELNICYQKECWLAVAMLLRAIIDHIPPIFGKAKFSEVANNYSGTKSFLQSMTHLDKSLRKIADSFLHSHIRSKESLPNETQVSFSPDLDVLLCEIYRILK